MLKFNLDVVIPSYRADMKYLRPILDLKKSESMFVNYFLILDNPKMGTPTELEMYVKNGNLTVIKNVSNLGAGKSRNIGIEAGKGEFILFLDDDIIPQDNLLLIYENEIKNNKMKNAGYVGVINFSHPINSFTRGLVASDILTFFSIATWKDELTWGVTANLIISREHLYHFRFAKEFPKFGGGEDIDLCIKIVMKSGYKFRPVKKAVVNHEWWNNGKRSYHRFRRWAYGDSRLSSYYPQYKYRNFLNSIELLFLIFVAFPFILLFSNPSLLFYLVIAVILSDFIVEWLKMYKNKRIISPILVLESVFIRNSSEIGRLKGHLSRKHILGITERFDYFCDGQHIKFEKIWAGVRFMTFIILFFIQNLMLGELK